MRRGRFLVGAVVMAASLALPSAALADGSLSVTIVAPGDARIGFTAGAGDANRVTFTVTGRTVTITDTGAQIVRNDASDADLYCAPATGPTITCTNIPEPLVRHDVDLRDGNDTFSGAVEQTVLVFGGDGNDEITISETLQGSSNAYGDDVAGVPAGDGDDRITGGAGFDFIVGGGGVDVMAGGDGDDFIAPGAGDRDRADGGPGNDAFGLGAGSGSGDVADGGAGLDEVSSSTSDPGPPFGAALSVDLALGSLNLIHAAPVSATLVSIEDFQGGGANVVATGTDGPNRMSTGDGADSLNGGLGADYIGTGAGDDRLFARDGFGDRLRCGDGSDSAEVDQLDEAIDCESVALALVRPAGAEADPPGCSVQGLTRRVRRSRFLRGVSLQVSCDEAAALSARLSVPLRRQKGRLRPARAGDLVLAERSLPLATGVRTLRLKAPRALRRALGRRFRVSVSLVARDEFGNTQRITRSARIR